jgi:hypothetical protein
MTLPTGVPKRGKITTNDKPLREWVVGIGQIYRKGICAKARSRKGAKIERK